LRSDIHRKTIFRRWGGEEMKRGRKPTETIKIGDKLYEGRVKPFARSGAYIPMQQKYVGCLVEIKIIPEMIE